MPSRSAHIDDATDRLVQSTAQIEDRTPSQITGAALRWYLHLSPSARDAMRRIEAAGEDAIREASWVLSRALLDRQYEFALQQGLETMKHRLPTGASEDDIMAEAVRLTRRG